MSAEHVVNVDLAKVWSSPGRKDLLRVLGWGDAVEVEDITSNQVRIKTFRFVEQQDGSVRPTPVSGFIEPTRGSKIKASEVVIPKGEDRVLKVNFVDVQQGDGSVIETPQGKVILVDGGDNQLFARYLAGRYRGSSENAPKEVECIVVSHGDADHFAGLTKIRESESHETAWKRLFIHPRRVYHNGLVKHPTTVNGKTLREEEQLGETTTVDGRKVITELAKDLREVNDLKMNKFFLAWKQALQHWSQRGPIEFRRLAQGDDDAFDFLREEGISVEVLGPIPMKLSDGRVGLPFLGKPPEAPHIDHDPKQPTGGIFSGLSASHTINGHSVILRLAYGDFRFLLAGDLNQQAELELVRSHPEQLRAEVLKVPHHGSADFSTAFLEAVCPLVSVVSSGDESSRKEFIHPRASLMGALGRFSRIPEPLIFVTEMVAFFEVKGQVNPERHEMKEGAVVLKDGRVVDLEKVPSSFFAFSRKAFGLVKIRTDGKRLLALTDSANVELKEAYAYQMVSGTPVPVAVRME